MAKSLAALTFNIGLDEFLRCVPEYLIDNYCEEETRNEGFQMINRCLRENFVHGAEAEAIRFDIARKRGWDALTNTNADEAVRSADCYVFCLYPEQNASKADVLDADAWVFYVLSTDQIERELGAQKSVGLSRLRTMVEPVTYKGLQARIDTVLSESCPLPL